MNWDAIGAIGEVVGALAVVCSLLYLAVQIRHSSKMAGDSAFRDVSSAVTNQLNAMSERPNAQIILKGLKDFNSLSGDEKYIFDCSMSNFITLVESAFISNQARFISDDTMEGWSFFLRARYLSYPGWQAWWQENKGIFIPEAQEWFDKQIELVDPEHDCWRIL